MTGTELRLLRTAIGLTQVQLADAIGMHPNTVARMERDELLITRRTETSLRLLHAASRPPAP
jgi:transcriptional regulator with XRE-family HTH domain